MTSSLIIAQAASDTVGIVGGVGARALIVGLLTGIAFGAILQRVGASSYEMIVNMLRLKDLTILKFFFLAVGAGSLGIYILNSVGTAHIGIAPLYLLGITVGGLIFGVGWAISGYCPGTSLAAIGEGKIDAVITVLGGLVGALVLALTWDWIKPVLVDPLNFNADLPDVLGVKPLLVAIVLTAAIVAFVIHLDRVDSRRKPAAKESAGKTPGPVTGS